MLVKIDNTPARMDADATITQLTAPITEAVPTVAIAVCATVFNALTDAALIQAFVFSLIINTFLLEYAAQYKADNCAYHRRYSGSDKHVKSLCGLFFDFLDLVC